MEGTILVADDDRTIRTVLAQALTRAGCRVRATGTASTLWRWIEEGEGDVVVTDVMMPDGDALDLLPAIRKRRPDLPVIVMSAQNTVMTAIRAAEVGAYEYLPKPFDLKEVLGQVSKALNHKSRRLPLPEEDQGREDNLPLIGRSPAMQEVYRILARLMNTDLGVMISGESGTGKELVARALHNYGLRKAGPFVAINMAAIPRDLIESELFGHEKGAFTGADRAMAGKFEQAQRRHALPRRGRRHAARRADPAPAGAPGGRVRPRRRPRAPDGGRAHRRGDPPGPAQPDQRGPVPRGPLLPPQRGADPPSAAPRAARGRPRPRTCLPPQGRDRGPAAQEHLKGGARHPQEAGLVGQRARAGEPDAPALRPLPGRRDLGSGGRSGDLGAAELGTTLQPTQPQRLAHAIEAHLRRYFDLHGDSLPPDGLYDRILKEMELPLIALSLTATRGNQVRTAELLGINRNTLRKKIKDLDIRVTRGKRMM